MPQQGTPGGLVIVATGHTHEGGSDTVDLNRCQQMEILTQGTHVEKISVPRSACGNCKRRKTRCDRSLPGCDTCVRLHQVCLYPSERKRPGPRVGSFNKRTRRDDGHSRGKNQEQQTPSTSSQADKSSVTRVEHAGHICPPDWSAGKARIAVESILDVERPASLTETSRSTDPTQHDDPRSASLWLLLHPSHEESILGACRENTQVNSHHCSSGEAELDSISHACHELNISVDTMHTLVDLYFENMTAFSLFHRPSFEERLRSISNPLHLSCLLAAMSAFSSRFAGEGHGGDWVDLLNEHPSKIPCPDHFHQLALRCEEEALTDCGDDAPPLCFLQAVILSTWFQLVKGVRGRSWRWLGITIRMAYELNLHLVDSGTSEDWAPSTPTEVQEWCVNEERRRAWWAIWEMDIFASTIKRLPTAIKASQIQTHLPVEDRFWFEGQFHSSCSLKMDPMDRWKSVQRTGNESSTAWLILVASLMQDAQVSPASEPTVIIANRKTSRTKPGLSQESRSCTEETARILTLTTHALQCSLMTLPDALCYRDEYLSFSSPNPAEIIDRRKMDSARYSIYLTTQLARFMIHSHSLFGQSPSGSADMENENQRTGDGTPSSDQPSKSTGKTKRVIDRNALQHYTDPANNILGIINRSSPDHIRYVNPFLASTVWLAAAVQIVEANIGTANDDKAIQDSKVQVLRLTYEKHVKFWDTPRTLLEGLDTLDAYLKSSISSKYTSSAQGNVRQGQESHVSKELPAKTAHKVKKKGPNLTGTGYSSIFLRSPSPSFDNVASSTTHPPSKLVSAAEDVLDEACTDGDYFPDFQQTQEVDLDNLTFDFDLGFGMAADLECSLMGQWRLSD